MSVIFFVILAQLMLSLLFIVLFAMTSKKLKLVRSFNKSLSEEICTMSELIDSKPTYFCFNNKEFDVSKPMFFIGRSKERIQSIRDNENPTFTIEHSGVRDEFVVNINVKDYTYYSLNGKIYNSEEIAIQDLEKIEIARKEEKITSLLKEAEEITESLK